MNKLTLKHISFCLLAALVLCLTACGTSSSAVSNTPPATGGIIGTDSGISRELEAAGENVDILSSKESLAMARAVAKTYTPWQQVSLKGKARVEGVPVALSVKVYMVRGNCVRMSLSAPLLGEVGRLELGNDSMLVVNKRSKTYCVEPVGHLMAEFGATIRDVQDLLMGRVFLLGSGTLTESNAPLFEVSRGASSACIFTPRTQLPDVQYGFTLYPDGKMMMAAAGTNDESYMATMEYEYTKKNTQADLSLTIKGKTKRIELTFEEPDYSPSPLDGIALNPKWTRTTLRKLFSGLK